MAQLPVFSAISLGSLFLQGCAILSLHSYPTLVLLQTGEFWNWFIEKRQSCDRGKEKRCPLPIPPSPFLHGRGHVRYHFIGQDKSHDWGWYPGVEKLTLESENRYKNTGILFASLVLKCLCSSHVFPERLLCLREFSIFSLNFPILPASSKTLLNCFFWTPCDYTLDVQTTACYLVYRSSSER